MLKEVKKASVECGAAFGTVKRAAPASVVVDGLEGAGSFGAGGRAGGAAGVGVAGDIERMFAEKVEAFADAEFTREEVSPLSVSGEG